MTGGGLGEIRSGRCHTAGLSLSGRGSGQSCFTQVRVSTDSRTVHFVQFIGILTGLLCFFMYFKGHHKKDKGKCLLAIASGQKAVMFNCRRAYSC